ncbi:hypothetical protein LJR235_002294 [Pararhizobium sp. LjRoot235]|uniref:hypothetical protein n=1 Tax=Pararhizobium sp. LjRoot235 TaxID=3342291 RepID=UPI003ED0C46D
MNAVTVAIQSRVSVAETSCAPYSSVETAVHLGFAAKAANAEGWKNTSEQYLAMHTECSRLGLRPCSFRQFRRQISYARRTGRKNHPPGMPKAAPSFWPKASRPSDLNELLESLDRDTLSRW